MNEARARQIEEALNAVLTTCEATAVPAPSTIGEWDGGEYCVIIFDKEPELAVLCTFDDGEVLYEPQEAALVITEWNDDARGWLMRVISAELYAEREAADAVVRLRSYDEVRNEDATIQS